MHALTADEISLVPKIDLSRRLFAVTSLEPGGNFMSLKSVPDRFSELTQRPGIVPAPYMARSFWVAPLVIEAV